VNPGVPPRTRAEVLRTEDVGTNAVRDGVAASVEQRFENQMAVEVGVRHARETNGPALPTGTLGVPSEGVVPDHVTTARARLTGPLPFLPGALFLGQSIGVTLTSWVVDRWSAAVALSICGPGLALLGLYFAARASHLGAASPVPPQSGGKPPPR
jgi:hypothetical protein